MKALALFVPVWIATAARLAAQMPAFVDTRGPVQNTDMRVQVDQEGVQAPGYIFPKPEALTTWTAKWISSAAPAAPDSAAACVRKEVTLSQTPKKVTAWITGDNYLLYVNGKPAARGPADAGHDFIGATSNHRFYDCRDLTPLFHPGDNGVAAELIGGGSFQLEARIEYPDGQVLTLQTDNTWKAIASPYLKNTGLPPDVAAKMAAKGNRPLFVAEAEPTGWLLAGFNDAAWPACRVSPPPATPLVLSERLP